MRKLIATINMTLDGFCDHTAMLADEDLHQHYTELLNNSGVILYGRVTYLLMENFWPAIVKNPTGNKSMDEFALAIENIPKIVFSNTMTTLLWENAQLVRHNLQEIILKLKQESGKNILVGSPGLIVSLTNLKLIDEFQLCIHPVVAGGGLSLFQNVIEKSNLRLMQTKAFKSGIIMISYQPIRE